MYFQQSDLFKGLDEGFVKEFMDLGEKKTYTTGHTLFHEGDPAGYFFVLLQGSVKITIGETGHTVYSVDQPGEVFGWSSLVGREKYTASAECREKTTLFRTDVGSLNKLLENNAGTGMLFFKGLAGVLGNRLLQTYKLMSGAAEADISRSYGTGQVLESDVKVS
jgi:CRP/FNR family cyclic AMP-dependent transcriptional regulator